MNGARCPLNAVGIKSNVGVETNRIGLMSHVFETGILTTRNKSNANQINFYCTTCQVIILIKKRILIVSYMRNNNYIITISNDKK